MGMNAELGNDGGVSASALQELAEQILRFTVAVAARDVEEPDAAFPCSMHCMERGAAADAAHHARTTKTQRGGMELTKMHVPHAAMIRVEGVIF
jgi:hypothetical protein